MKERRKACRYYLALPLTVQAAINNEPTCLHGGTVDISMGGVYFRIGSHNLRVGMKLGLAMRVGAGLAEGKELFILGIGDVVRVERRVEDGVQNPGVAVSAKRYEYFRDGLSDRPAESLSSLLQSFAMRQKQD